MIFAKKAIGTHIIVLVVVSAIMSALIISVFSAFFKNDHQDCQYYEFEVVRKCNDGNAVRIDVQNKGNRLINFKSDNSFSKKYQVPISEQVRMDFGAKNVDIVDLIPFVKTIQGEEFECRGKTQSIQLSRLIKCP